MFSYIINAQTTYVPDDNFEQRLIDLGLDDVLDNYVLTANISSVSNLDIQYRSISDATGLEDFSSLSGFNCDNNQISSLSFHENVNLNFFICQYNPIAELDLTQHTALFEFSCTNTHITTIDLSQNTNLRYLYCSGTPVVELDLTNNSNLLEVYASNSNFQYVDLRNNNNTEIGQINFTNNPNLPYIYVDDCNYSTANWTLIDSTTIFIEEEGDTECEPLGINDINLDLNISVYPNPVSDFLFITNNGINIESIAIINVSGKRVKRMTNDFSKIDFNQLSEGIYFVYIVTDRGELYKKIIRH